MTNKGPTNKIQPAVKPGPHERLSNSCFLYQNCSTFSHCVFNCEYYWNLQFLNNVIIIHTKVLLPQTQMTLADFGCPVYVLWFYC